VHPVQVSEWKKIMLEGASYSFHFPVVISVGLTLLSWMFRK
jgi:hypothetical protein